MNFSLEILTNCGNRIKCADGEKIEVCTNCVDPTICVVTNNFLVPIVDQKNFRMHNLHNLVDFTDQTHYQKLSTMHNLCYLYNLHEVHNLGGTCAYFR